MTLETTERSAMAKTQKTFYLNDDLTRLLAQLEKRSGASFTRIVTAAIIGYLFETPEGPTNKWMEYAVSLENAEATVGDFPKLCMEDVAAKALFAKANAEELEGELKREWIRWKRMIEQEGEDLLQKILSYRATHVHYSSPPTE